MVNEHPLYRELGSRLDKSCEAFDDIGVGLGDPRDRCVGSDVEKDLRSVGEKSVSFRLAWHQKLME